MAIIWERAAKDNRQSADVKLPQHQLNCTTLLCRAAKDNRQSADVKLPQHQLKCTTLLCRAAKDNRQSADVKSSVNKRVSGGEQRVRSLTCPNAFAIILHLSRHGEMVG
ncbi:MAG: hypothetical protein M9928_21425 [Anaerolineae bacterium]|nr:hypothetical protein [Anaerolineae bacterium]MCO5191785.1 hypothetical protein [Anaerolineae bacterium]MCO5199026.1 hypothetical protein [Anaerolineae bacterium]MCO5207578.1 hypothetical protein [Anaerolineae bacterium]